MRVEELFKERVGDEEKNEVDDQPDEGKFHGLFEINPLGPRTHHFSTVPPPVLDEYSKINFIIGLRY